MKKIAALITEYRPGTHADVLISKFLHGFAMDDPAVHPPRVQLRAVNSRGVPQDALAPRGRSDPVDPFQIVNVPPAPPPDRRPGTNLGFFFNDKLQLWYKKPP